MNRYLGLAYPVVLILVTLFFFSPFFINGKLPIPADTIVGLYHPFRDLYAGNYPNGIPYKNFLITDPVRQQYPWRFLALNLMKNGQLPIWNPYNFAGSPLLANFQNGAFYPLNFLFFILPFPIGWSILILLEPLLAGLFMYIYLRQFKLNYQSSLFGAFTYAFCGFSVSWMEWGTLTQVALWLPLILNAKEHLLNKITWRWSVILLFADISALLAGHVQTFFYLCCISISYILLRAYQKQKTSTYLNTIGNYSKRLFPYFCYGVILLCLTAVQWVPSLQFIFKSARDVDQINAWLQPGWFIPWQNLIQFLAPDFFGNPATLNYWGIWNYGEFIGYVGILPLLFALFALFYRKDKKTLYFGILFFLSLIFSLPTIFAKLPFILNIPLLSTAQPTRLLFVTDFSLSILCALGLDHYIRISKKVRILSPLFFIGALFFLLWIYVLKGSGFIPLVTKSDISVALHNLYFPTLLYILTLVSILLSIFIKQKHIQNMLIISILLITIVDLLRFAQKFTPFTNPSYLYPQTSSLTYLQKQTGEYRVMETDNEILPPNFSIMYHIQSIDGYDPLYLRTYGELLAAIERNAPDIHTPLGFNRIISPHDYTSPLMNLLGVKYILSLSDITSPQFEKVFTEGQTRVYENKNVLKRAFFVNSVIPAESKNEAIKDLFNNQNNLARLAVVEGWDSQKTYFANGSANIVEYSADKIVLSTQNNNTGYLVFTDAYYPTWHASICLMNQTICNAVPIYLTDYAMRGIVVPSGRHMIIFSDSLF